MDGKERDQQTPGTVERDCGTPASIIIIVRLGELALDRARPFDAAQPRRICKTEIRRTRPTNNSSHERRMLGVPPPSTALVPLHTAVYACGRTGINASIPVLPSVAR